jgi:excisionase family DNA binding protein
MEVILLVPQGRRPTVVETLVRPERAAELLDCGRSTIYELLATGQLHSVKIGKLRRIPLSAIDEYVARLVSAGSDA